MVVVSLENSPLVNLTFARIITDVYTTFINHNEFDLHFIQYKVWVLLITNSNLGLLKVEKKKLQKKLVLNIIVAKGRGRESRNVCVCVCV
jgi:hypothetical protein